MTLYTGRCACGKIRYEIAAAPIRGFQCQCRDPQRDTGAGHASVMVFPRAVLKVTGEPSEILRVADSGAQKVVPELVMFASRGNGWNHLDPALPKLPNMRPSK
jgi:hypothetical protein